MVPLLVRHSQEMIRTFRDKVTESIFAGRRTRDVPVELFKRARNKLLILNAAFRLDDLRSPPGNRLELLSGDRAGTYSIRVNDQYRICFRWTDQGIEDVEFTDYH